MQASLWKRQDTLFIKAKTDTVTVRVPYSVEVPITKYKVARVACFPSLLKWSIILLSAQNDNITNKTTFISV